jgi:hypothetical protein
MNAVPLTELPTYHAPAMEGSVADVLVPPELLKSLQVTKSMIKGSPVEARTIEATLSLTVIGSQVSPREFECALCIKDGLVTAEAQSGDITFRIVMQFDATAPTPQRETWEINFRLLPHPDVETALWFHEFAYEVLFGGRPIRIRLRSQQLILEAQAEHSHGTKASPELAAQMEEMILFYRQLLSIKHTFHTSFRIPERLSAQDVLTTDMVYRAITDGGIAATDIYQYRIQSPGPRKYHEQDADVRVVFADVSAIIFGQRISLGRAVFWAPSARIRCLDSAEEPYVIVEIDFRKFGGYSFFLDYLPPQKFALLGTSKEDLASHLPEGLNLNLPKVQLDMFEAQLLSRAQWESEQIEKRISVLLGRQRERFEAILTWFAQLDEEVYEDPGEITWREPELIE